MTTERVIISHDEVDALSGPTYVFIDEASVRCKNLNELSEFLAPRGSQIVALMMGDFEEGTREYAKAQIVCSFNNLQGILPVDEEGLGKLVNSGAIIHYFGFPEMPQQYTRSESRRHRNLEIPQTQSEEDSLWMKAALSLVDDSDCWWRPTACIWVKNDEPIMVGSSSNPYHTDCKLLNITAQKIALSQGQRIDFCNATHAERISIAHAAREGVNLKDTTLYVTVCPCEECAKVVLETGVTRVVYNSEYYDQAGVHLLEGHNIEVFQTNI